jgi:hypothetical protein
VSDEGFRITVVVVEVSADGVFQFASAAVNVAAQLLFSEQGEQALRAPLLPATPPDMGSASGGSKG